MSPLSEKFGTKSLSQYSVRSVKYKNIKADLYGDRVDFFIFIFLFFLICRRVAEVISIRVGKFLPRHFFSDCEDCKDE